MLFGALFSSYVLLRTSATTWPLGYTILNVPLATLNTVFLIGSSVTMIMSWASLKMHDFGKYRLYMGLTFLAGLAFMVVKSYESTRSSRTTWRRPPTRFWRSTSPSRGFMGCTWSAG